MTPPPSPFFIIEGGIGIRHGHEIVWVQAWGQDSVRVRAGQHQIATHDVGALDATRPAGEPTIEFDGTSLHLSNGAITVVAELPEDQANPQVHLSYRRSDDLTELLSEQREHFWAPGARVYYGNRSGSYELHQEFCAYPGERLYGMGQRTHGRLDLKGLSLDLVQRNAEVNIPFVLSNRGYGLLWNNPAVGRVEFADNSTRWTAGQAKQIDYWVTAGSRPADILEHYADATGHSPVLPEWATGFWQSKLRYKTQDELLGVAREFSRRDLPISVIVADYFHWSAMGDYRFDAEEWPDPEAMVTELRELGIELMVSIWPTISPLSENFETYRNEGLLLGSDQGLEMQQMIRDKGMAEPVGVGFYDPTNPRTREYVWSLIRRNYLEMGIRVWWLDADEPELNPATPANLSLWAGPGSEVVNIYPRDNARLFFEGMQSEGLPPTVLLSRSAWAGSQKYGAAVWSGDIPATWSALAVQVRAGLNIAISGIPWWTTDIGGFHGGDSTDPEYQELMTRWFQFGVFCPLFRLHGDREPRTPTGYTQTGGPNEPWSFGDQASARIETAIRLRERLRPYVQEQMSVASEHGLPPMRPLFIDYPEDAAAWRVDDEFLFGPDLLVAPVLRSRQEHSEVYLPHGASWVDAYTGQEHAGGQTIEVNLTLDSIPVYVRAGSALARERDHLFLAGTGRP